MSAKSGGAKHRFGDLLTNRKARHEYTLGKTFEAGIVLVGTEVKSLRERRGSIQEAWVGIDNNEVYVHSMHIGLYADGTWTNHSEKRTRKLLLHKAEIAELARSVREKGSTIVVTRAYLVDGRVKLELALARGKREYDKRAAITERDQKREIASNMRSAEKRPRG